MKGGDCLAPCLVYHRLFLEVTYYFSLSREIWRRWYGESKICDCNCNVNSHHFVGRRGKAMIVLISLKPGKYDWSLRFFEAKCCNLGCKVDSIEEVLKNTTVPPWRFWLSCTGLEPGHWHLLHTLCSPKVMGCIPLPHQTWSCWDRWMVAQWSVPLTWQQFSCLLSPLTAAFVCVWARTCAHSRTSLM